MGSQSFATSVAGRCRGTGLAQHLVLDASHIRRCGGNQVTFYRGFSQHHRRWTRREAAHDIAH
ncbi:hypothetical protein GCM10009526_05060 [Glutamicibacter creatinolyticus]